MDSRPLARLRVDVPALPHTPSVTETQRVVLLAAIALFARDGYHATSTRDLATALGWPVGALYQHFPSKAHILAELVRTGHEAHHAALASALLESGSDPVDQLRALVRAHARFHCEYAMAAVVAHDEMHGLPSELAASSLAILALSKKLLTDVVARGAALGRFHPPDPFVTAAAIGAMGMRIAHWYAGEPPERIAEIHAELALRMVGVTP